LLRRADVLGDQDRHGTPLGQTLDDREKNDFRHHIGDAGKGQFITVSRQRLRLIPPVQSGLHRSE
jgi:hypothetical protein